MDEHSLEISCNTLLMSTDRCEGVVAVTALIRAVVSSRLSA